MRIDGTVIDKNIPDWANGHVVTIGDKRLLMLSAKPRLIYPRWWNRLGIRLGWRWLSRLTREKWLL